MSDQLKNTRDEEIQKDLRCFINAGGNLTEMLGALGKIALARADQKAKALDKLGLNDAIIDLRRVDEACKRLAATAEVELIDRMLAVGFKK